VTHILRRFGFRVYRPFARDIKACGQVGGISGVCA
jgi:hypothetical protein